MSPLFRWFRSFLRPSFGPLKYIFSAILTLVFLVLAFRGTDFAKLQASLRQANYWWLVLSLVVLLASHLLRAWRWRYLLEPIKPAISLRNLFAGVMVGYMMNNVLPRAGELARPYAIGKLESISRGAAFGTVVVERIMDTVAFLSMVAAIPLLYRGPLRESFSWLHSAGLLITLIMGPLLVLLIALMLRRDWTDMLLRVADKLFPEKLGRRLSVLAHNFLDGFLFLKRPSNFLVIMILSVLIWFSYAIMTYVAFYAFGFQDSVGFSGAIIVLAISSIGVAMPTPGATGSYHAFTSQALIQLFAIDPAVALSYATLTHAAGFIGVTVVGLYFFVKDNISMSAAVANSHEKIS